MVKIWREMGARSHSMATLCELSSGKDRQLEKAIEVLSGCNEQLKGKVEMNQQKR